MNPISHIIKRYSDHFDSISVEYSKQEDLESNEYSFFLFIKGDYFLEIDSELVYMFFFKNISKLDDEIYGFLHRIREDT